jgi:hypothetical protein
MPAQCFPLVSVVSGCITAMAVARTDSDTAAAVAPRRGKSKAPNFSYAGPVSVIPLELDVLDDRARQRLERQWEAVFRLRRALQRDAQDRCRAYWAAEHERAADPRRCGSGWG